MVLLIEDGKESCFKGILLSYNMRSEESYRWSKKRKSIDQLIYVLDIQDLLFNLLGHIGVQLVLKLLAW